MNNDNNPNYEKTQRTVRPQMMQRESSLQRDDQPMQQQQLQQQASGKVCPFCGTINDPEAMFCFQCGMPTTAKFAIVTLRKMFAPSAELICRATRLIALSAVARKEA